MTTPNGSPPWLRNAGITDYGGSTTKADFMGQGMVNPDTDLEAAALMRLTDHMAACTRTAPFAVLNLTCDDTAPGPPTVNYAWMMSGVCLTSYVGNAPPAGFPSAARNGDGDVTITFAASYLDAYGVSGAFAPRMAKVTANDTGNIVAVALTSGVTVRVHIFVGDTGVAATNKTFTLTVW
jgi:hypothetical protein